METRREWYERYLTEWVANPWVYAAVSGIAGIYGRVNRSIEFRGEWTREKGQRYGHVSDLFFKNKELEEEVVWHLVMTGNAFVHMSRGEDGLPTSLSALRPSMVTPVGEGLPSAYMWQANPKTNVCLAQRDVVHFFRPNPREGFWGMGAPEAVGKGLEGLARDEILTLFGMPKQLIPSCEEYDPQSIDAQRFLIHETVAPLLHLTQPGWQRIVWEFDPTWQYRWVTPSL